MYYYIYDQFLNDKKYQSILTKIENRLTDLEIQGKIGKLSLLNNQKELIESEIKKGTKTIVAVGDDSTINKTINILAYHPDVCLGIIPIGSNQKIARTLGLPENVGACNALASRIIKKIDIGKIKNNYFLSQVEVIKPDVILDCDDNYKIYVNKNDSLYIYNFNYWSDAHLADPGDGLLEIVVIPKNKHFIKKIINPMSDRESIFLNKKIKITHQNNPVQIRVDDNFILKTPLLVEIASHQLKIIVGKQRTFN